MTTKDEALKMAITALEYYELNDLHWDNADKAAIAACRKALAQKDCECFSIALDAANRTKEACINATGKKKNIEAYVNAVQIAHNAAGTDFDTLAQRVSRHCMLGQRFRARLFLYPGTLSWRTINVGLSCNSQARLQRCMRLARQ